MLVLGLVANWLAAALLAFTIFFYAVVYSMWLKRWTAQNIVIGGAAGAFPPMIGEAAVTGTVRLETFVLFAIIFLWTPPHFWALALVKSDDYARAGIPMLPNVAGPDATRRQILLYTLAARARAVSRRSCSASAASPTRSSPSPAALGMIALAVAGLPAPRGRAGDRAAQQLFGFSILYLFLLFAALLAEHGLGLLRPLAGIRRMSAEQRDRSRVDSAEEQKRRRRALARDRAGARRPGLSCSTW